MIETKPEIGLNPPKLFPYRALIWYALFLLLSFWPVLNAMAYQWQADEDMGHGFFVPLIAGYIAWERKDQLLKLPAVRNKWGLLLVVYGTLQLWLGVVGAEVSLQRTSFLITLAGLVLFHGGVPALRILAFPLGLLVFMVPIPGIIYKQITFPLQLLASRLAEGILEVLGYMVIREGNVLELAGQLLSVVEACSGLRSLLSLSFFSLSYAYLFDPRPWVRWVLLGATAPVAVIANSTRIVITGVMGEYDQALANGVYHTASGWILFLIAIAMLLLIRQAAVFVVERRKRS